MPTIDRNLSGATAFGKVVVSAADYPPPSGATSIRGRTRAGWLVRVAERCRELFSLPAGWDGYTAQQVDADLIQKAWDFAQVAACSVSGEPSVVPTVSGGVALEWHARGIDLEIELTSTGTIILLEDEAGEVEGPLSEHAERVAAALHRL